MSSTLQKITMPTNITHLLETILPSNSPGPQFMTSCVLLATTIGFLAASGYFNSNKVLRKTLFLGNLGFFSARHDFMNATLRIAQDKQRKENKNYHKGGTYAFEVANFKIHVLHGEVGRKVNATHSFGCQCIPINVMPQAVLWGQKSELVSRLSLPSWRGNCLNVR